MKKIKIFLLVFSVMMIAATFYKGIAIAAQVTRINADKGLIIIDGNKDDGFIIGAKVCFYSASGEKTTCGRVQQTSDSYATVKLNNRVAIQIKYGMEAKIPVEKSDEKVTKEDKGCSDDPECGDFGVCINGKCY
ncbi:MAG: hypothetical protein P8Z35_12055 [Ignavibacteriaceae bacterium]|jgi:hypothetical protein